jgi:hypothetical protein
MESAISRTSSTTSNRIYVSSERHRTGQPVHDRIGEITAG